MEEDDLFAGSMEIDDPAATPASRAGLHVSAPRPGVDEDMSEVAQIMLNLKVRGKLPCYRVAPLLLLLRYYTVEAG